MDTFERLYEALLLDRADQSAKSELLALMKSSIPEIRWAAYDTLKDFALLPGVLKQYPIGERSVSK